MNKQQIYEYLKQENIGHEITEHKAVYNMDELSKLKYHIQNMMQRIYLFVMIKRNYYLITVKGDKRVDLKEFRKNNNTRPLSFASSDDLMDIMKLIPGAVTPLELLNDDECKVTLFLDEEFMNGLQLVGVHPNDNTATVWLKVNDLIKIIKQYGNQVNVIKI